MTRVDLELLTDPDMYLFIEEGLKGGISMISSRYGRAKLGMTKIRKGVI